LPFQGIHFTSFSEGRASAATLHDHTHRSPDRRPATTILRVLSASFLHSWSSVSSLLRAFPFWVPWRPSCPIFFQRYDPPGLICGVSPGVDVLNAGHFFWQLSVSIFQPADSLLRSSPPLSNMCPFVAAFHRYSPSRPPFNNRFCFRANPYGIELSSLSISCFPWCRKKLFKSIKVSPPNHSAWHATELPPADYFLPPR